MSLRKEIKDILYPDKLDIHILYEHNPDDTIPDVNKLYLKTHIEHQTVSILARIRKRIDLLDKKEKSGHELLQEIKEMLEEDEDY